MKSTTTTFLVIMLASCGVGNTDKEKNTESPNAGTESTTADTAALNGTRQTFHRSGKLKSEYSYSNGLLDGPAALFDSLGRRRIEQWYSKGILKSEVKYTEEGFPGDPKFLWKIDELPLFKQEYIKLSVNDTILEPGVEYRFTVSVPGIPDFYFRTSTTNALLYRASQTEYALKAKSGPETCISLLLSLGDTVQIPFGKRCFSVRQ